MPKPGEFTLDPHRHQIEQWLGENVSGRAIVRRLNSSGVSTSETSLRRALKRWRTDRPDTSEQAGVTISGDEASVTSKPSPELKNAEQLMADRGLDPEEWEIRSVTVNEWDSPTGIPMHQLKVHLRRVIPLKLINPARIEGPTFKPKRRAKQKPTKVVLVGDQQAPYHDEVLHKAFTNFLDDFQPDKGVLIGDTIDLPDISRHPNNPEKDVTVQQCVDTGYLILRNYREASSDTAWQKLSGNHDERLRRVVIDNMDKLYGLRRAEVPGEPVESPLLDIGHLLRLDELGVEYVLPNGDYEHSQVTLSPYLAARHGWIARKGSGATALATLQHLGYSVVVGHSHRQSIVHHTRHDIEGTATTLSACETGCMCRVDGLGYAVAPDWQQGFATASIWPDGTFKLDLGTFVDGTLYYGHERY